MEPQKPLKVSVGLTLDENIVKELRTLAAEDDRPLSSCINLILRNYLRELEKRQ